MMPYGLLFGAGTTGGTTGGSTAGAATVKLAPDDETVFSPSETRATAV